MTKENVKRFLEDYVGQHTIELISLESSGTGVVIYSLDDVPTDMREWIEAEVAPVRVRWVAGPDSVVHNDTD